MTEYVGVIVVVAVLLVAVVAAATTTEIGQSLTAKITCAVRSLGTQAGNCGGSEGPVTYARDGQYANAENGRMPLDRAAVDAAVERFADTILDGGWNGVRQPELEAAEEAISGLNGAEIDAFFAELSDEDLTEWFDQMDDGVFFGGWSYDRRRQFWENVTSRASKSTLDRLAELTDEIQPAYDEVGGDEARAEPQSPANSGVYGEIPHELIIDGIEPTDVAQGQIGDCWWVASMMAVAQADPGVIEDAINENANGSYTVRLYDNGQPVYVTVTPDMVLQPDGTPAFVNNNFAGESYELWPMVMEKAMALHWGDYADIEADSPGTGVSTITGQPSHTALARFSPSMDDMESLLADGGAVLLGTFPPPTPDSWLPDTYGEAEDGKLVEGHAYYVQSVDVAADTITVINPWGSDYPPVVLTHAQFDESFGTFFTNEVHP